MANDSGLDRAFDYPYEHLAYPFNFRNGVAQRLKSYSARAMLDAGYTPVLGVGSNCAPAQLARKFAGAGGVWEPLAGHALTVAPARLVDFDVVYAAYVAGYGSIPATLQGSPGTAVGVCVTFLGARELRRMHETEAVGVAYDYVRLGSSDGGSGALDLTLGSGERLSEAWTYSARRGCLLLDGGNVALSAMRAEGRRFPTLSQREVLDRIRLDYDRGRHASLEEFVLSLIGPDNQAWREVLYWRFAANQFNPGHVAAQEENPPPAI